MFGFRFEKDKYGNDIYPLKYNDLVTVTSGADEKFKAK